LTLYASGRTTGTVLQSGGGVTHALSVYEGHGVQESCVRLDLGGSDIDEYLKNEYKENGKYDIIGGLKVPASSPVCVPASTDSTTKQKAPVNDFAVTSVVRQIKETLGYAALNYSEESSKPVADVERKYELPDGTMIDVEQERFKCVEAMFQPNIVGKNESGIHEAIISSIKKCDEEVRSELYNNIILGGGNCMFPELVTRLGKELADIAPSSCEVRISSAPEMKYSSWVGGSILSMMPSFMDRWIAKDEYDEFGPWIVHRKCF
jgi:actin